MSLYRQEGKRFRVGILGGGQLARMLMEPARRLDVDLVVLDADPCCPAKLVSGPREFKVSTGSPSSASDVCAFIKSQDLDVLSFDTEHICLDPFLGPNATIKGLRICPSPTTLAIIQDKFAQKVHLSEAGLPVAGFCEITIENDLQRFANGVYPVVLKARRNAYDGRGNVVVRSVTEIPKAFELLKSKLLSSIDSQKSFLYAEKYVDFHLELAVMVVRSSNGEVSSYPVVETVHSKEGSICVGVLAPPSEHGVSKKLVEQAAEIARKTVASFEGAGIFGVELFAMRDTTTAMTNCSKESAIFINEVAPRPHNSGHYTQDACFTSQFENHLRVLCGFPIGSTSMKVPFAGMLNVLGMNKEEETWDPCNRALKIQGATVHIYGKKIIRSGRKMAHINFVGKTQEEVRIAINACANQTIVFAANYNENKVVSVVMGSDSDLSVMKDAAIILEEFGIPFEITIVSAHRTPARLVEYANQARSRGIKVIIAGAGGAAHLPGMIAAQTSLPVIGVPIAQKHLNGIDSVHSILQMPRGVPVATVAIDNSTNAALLAIRILGAGGNTVFLDKVEAHQNKMNESVMEKVNDLKKVGWAEYKYINKIL